MPNVDLAGNNLIVDSIQISKSTATLVSNAATVTKLAGTITTESLTTAAGASQAFTITLVGLVAGDIASIQRAGGSNTRQNYSYSAVVTTNTLTVTVYNNEPTNALNGTLIFNYVITKK